MRASKNTRHGQKLWYEAWTTSYAPSQSSRIQSVLSSQLGGSRSESCRSRKSNPAASGSPCTVSSTPEGRVGVCGTTRTTAQTVAAPPHEHGVTTPKRLPLCVRAEASRHQSVREATHDCRSPTADRNTPSSVPAPPKPPWLLPTDVRAANQGKQKLQSQAAIENDSMNQSTNSDGSGTRVLEHPRRRV